MKSMPDDKFICLPKLIIMFFVMLSSLFLDSCSSSSAVKSSNAESSYNQVIRAGKIRAGYIIYPPYCMKDPTTHKISGIGPEALELIAKKLGLTIEYTEEVGWGNMVEGLQTSRYDIIAIPVWTNANRAKVAWFCKPLFFNPCFIYVRKGDNRFRGHLEKINSPEIIVSTVDGETADVIAQADFPKAKRLSMPQMTDISQAFLNVVTKKADIAIGEPGFVTRIMKENPNTLQRVDTDKPIRVFSAAWIIKRGESEFKAMLDTVLDEVINSGEMDRLIHKYNKDSLAIFSVAKPYQLK